MSTGSLKQGGAVILAGEGSEEEWRVIRAVALVHAGAALEELAHDVRVAGDCSEVDGSVAGVVGLLQELHALAAEELGDGGEVLVTDGVAEGGEGGLGGAEEGAGGENRAGRV